MTVDGVVALDERQSNFLCYNNRYNAEPGP
jgi:hypothetical protein